MFRGSDEARVYCTRAQDAAAESEELFLIYYLQNKVFLKRIISIFIKLYDTICKYTIYSYICSGTIPRCG